VSIRVVEKPALVQFPVALQDREIVLRPESNRAEFSYFDCHRQAYSGNEEGKYER